MTLQERLRACCECEQAPLGPLLGEAADALDAKDARIKELEGALREIARGMRGGQIMYASECWAIAREAIK